MNILGIETSCDETGIAIYNTEKQSIISEQLFSQASKHAEYGGVVPELASRDHLIKIIPLIKLTLEEVELEFSDLDGIAYTAGPGLRGPLLIGASMAKSLAFSLKIPSIGIHHMEAHLLINLLEDPAPKFPFLTLLISGGHCLLINAKEMGSYEIVGQTIDDAVGEAFDKVSKLLELGYPGGPLIEKLAESGDSSAFSFPRPMTNKDNLDFSFSGLKTAVFYTLKDTKFINKQIKANIAASFQDAVADTLLIKSRKALEETKQNELVIGGGVASNKYIRKKLVEGLKDNKIYFPPLERCTDNGAMVAFAGSFYLSNNNHAKNDLVRPKWPLSEL
ncbi:MAG TPA: tRNA (adenosine(37)-N6)-threonylcarbamoyltransferase complex transferase subunit TsaD [SAR86 cluster bacterium]|mgnify:FL=1|jgi:N6-L-threonylcarbamoyladenine synthase|nr:tRNA (adenosine(37)-N6)-threonylcarbamoyltransferase complex transferase subunit TsaD [SAR86 cluster bacterium]HJM15101.1 tRNA (adenosine(37)-N6)-threonylcarbamoyltransferase complex transferase subunit TsaD [SAR86 cluster bacterium]|tara:strand:+ start:237 stop:1238 length:1002 start_codon:yes stop_codon:yes gene_type:complete